MPDYSVCDRCGSHGLAVVPHPAYVVLGDWQPHHMAQGDGVPVYYTAVVYCDCARGARLQESHKEKNMSKVMSWKEYRETVLAEPAQTMADYKRYVDELRQQARTASVPTADLFKVPK